VVAQARSKSIGPLTLYFYSGPDRGAEIVTSVSVCGFVCVCVIGATTAEKLERTSRGVEAHPLLLVRPSPFPSLVSDPPMFHPFPPLLFFPSPLTFSKEVCKRPA